MADQAAPKAAAAPVLTPRDQELMVTALQCLENGEINVDFEKFATEGGFKDKGVARSKWSQIKKKIECGAKPSAASANGAATKAATPKTPRKTKESKTPTSTKKVAKATMKVGEEGDDAALNAKADDGDTKMEIDPSEGNRPTSAIVKVGTQHDSTPTDADDDSAMIRTPGSVDGRKGKASVADNMSAGSMSPPATPAPTKAKKTATPKAKTTLNAPKTPKTPKTPTDEGAITTPGDTTETPVPSSSATKKRGRKTKAQKEAEAVDTGDNGDENSGERPAKRARKTPVKQVKKDKSVQDGETSSSAGDDGEKEKSSKEESKAIVKTAKKEVAEDKDATNTDMNEAENGEKAKSAKKPRKSPVNKGKIADTTTASGESSSAVVVLKEKKKPGPQPGAAKGKKAKEAAEPTEASDEDAEQENIEQDAAAKVAQQADLAHAVLDGKKIQTNTFGTTAALANPPNWGTPINSMSPSPTKTEVNAKLGKEVVASATGTNHEVDGNDIVLASELVESIEVESYKTGDTIIVTTA